MAFECPGGTRFQQRTMVCDHQHLVDCFDSEQYFHSNLRIGQPDVNFIDDKSSFTFFTISFYKVGAAKKNVLSSCFRFN